MHALVTQKRIAKGIVHTEKGIRIVMAEDKRAYSLVGGGAGQTESRLRAMRREGAEEVSLRFRRMLHVGYHSGIYRPGNGGVVQKNTKLFFIAHATGQIQPGREIVKVAWWKPGSRLPLTHEAREEIENYLRLRKLLRVPLGYTKITGKKR